MNRHILQKLGFSENEIDVYITLLKRGRATPSAIAKLTKINRATVYHVAKQLGARGLVSEDLGGSTLYLVAHPPEAMVDALEKERTALKTKEELMNRAVAELSQLPSHQNYSVPKIRFVEEDDIKDFFKKNAMDWNDSALAIDKTWWGFQDHTLVEHYHDWITSFWKLAPKDSTVKLLSNESDVEQKLKGRFERRNIRFWKNAGAFTATTWVVGDYLIMVSTQHKPHYLVEIHDATLAHNMREVFKGIWKTLG